MTNRIRLAVLFILLPLCIFPADGESALPVQLQPPPGIYPKDITVSLKGAENLSYYFRESRDTTPCPYVVPLRLTAMPGEERTYTLVLNNGGVEETKIFTIDKRPPAPPVPDKVPGTYNRELLVTLSTEGGGTVYAAVDGLPTGAAPEDGHFLQQDRLEDHTYTIFAYSRDNAGNMSPLQSYTYTLRRNYKAESFLRIYSPVPGDFANLQLLACGTADFDWIRYSLDGRDPVIHGLPYTSPVLLDRTGNVQVLLAAMPAGGGEVIRKEVRYSVLTNGDPADLPAQGIYADSVKIPGLETDYHFTLDDSRPEDTDGLLHESLILEPVPGAEKAYILRLLPSQAGIPSGKEFRYVYLLDRRIPEPPLIVLSGESPVSEDVEASIKAGGWTNIYYSLDGRTPDIRSTPYRGPFTITLPEGIGFGSVIIKAAAYGPNNLKSPAVSRLISFDKDPPETPDVTLHGPLEDRTYFFTAESEYGTRLVYEFTTDGSEPDPPGKESPLGFSPLEFRVPYGMDQTFLVRFAAVDDAGNISPPSEVFSLFIDRCPPEAPELKLNKDGLTLEARENIYYRLDRREDFILYEGPASLPKKAEGSFHYYAEAYTQDDAGNRSPRAIASFSEESEQIRTPHFYGISEGGLYNLPSVSIRVAPSSSTDIVRYTFTTDGSEPEIPDKNSRIADGEITFEGPPDAEVTVTFRLASFSPDGNRVSEDVGSYFTIDRLKPGIPVIRGFENEGIYNAAVTFHAEAEEGTRVFFSLSTDNPIPPDPFGPEGLPMPDSYTVSAEEGVEKEYTIRIGGIDHAGNRTLNERIYSFIIDKQEPSLPDPIGIPAEGITNGNIHISFPPFQGSIYYTLTDDGSVPPEPDENSPAYREHIILHGEPGQEITYTLRTFCIDEAGNRGRDSRIYRCIIDQKIPIIPAAPDIEIAKNRSALLVSWPGTSPDAILFRIPQSKETWYDYNAPVSLNIPETLKRITLEYYSRDTAGNKSNIQILPVSLPFSSASPLFTGIEDGGIYNGEVRLYKSAGTSLCRYEVGVNTDTPPAVTPFSQVLPEYISLNAAKGETVRYSIRVKLFHEDGRNIVQREQMAAIIIDRDPPAPPEADGIRDGVYYQDDRTISFSSEEGSIRYIIRNADEDTPDLDDFNDYSRPLAIRTDEGDFSSYRIAAYVVDEAGNPSDVRTWNVSIDKEIIYVAENGNDNNDGTRTHPFRTIQKAFDHYKQTGRSTIYIAGGYYPLNDTLDLPGGVTLTGGYSAESWKREGSSETVFLPGNFFQRNKPMFHLGGGKNILKNIRVFDTSGLSSALIEVSGGECNISQSTFERTGSSRGTVILHNDGILYLNTSKVRVSRSSETKAIQVLGGTIFMSDTTVEGSGNSGNMTLVSMSENSRMLAGRSSFNPGQGRDTKAFEAVHSSIVLTECSVTTGTGSVSTSAFTLTGSTLECAASTVGGERDSRMTTLIVALDSEVTFYNSLMNIQALQGSVGIRASGSIINMANSRIQSGTTEVFSYIFNLEDTYGYFYTNHLTADATGDFAVMRITGGNLKWYSNTGRFKGGLQRSACFEAYQDPFLSIVNSIMIQTEPSVDSAFFKAEDFTGLECLCNDVYGWGFLAETKTGVLADVGLLNALDGDPRGGNVHGNIAENPSLTFTISKTEEFRLKESSSCINNGFDVRPLGGHDRDWDGQLRPNPYNGIKPAFDIGADEYYE